MPVTNKTLAAEIAKAYKNGCDDTTRELSLKLITAESNAEKEGFADGYGKGMFWIIRRLLESNTIIYDEKIGYGSCNKIAIAGRSDADIAAVIERVEVGL